MRTLIVKVVINPDDQELNSVTSEELFDDIQKTIRAGYSFLREDEIEVIWCSDDQEPNA